MSTKAIVDALSVLNAVISAAENAQSYRNTVSKAVAEGRDITDEELQAASDRLDDSIRRAEEA